MSNRADKIKLIQELYNGVVIPDDVSVRSRTHSLRIKSSGSVKLPDKKKGVSDNLETDHNSTESSFNKKPGYKWLYEPQKLRSHEFVGEFALMEWFRGIFHKKTNKYNLLLSMIAQERSSAAVGVALSMNDLSVGLDKAAKSGYRSKSKADISESSLFTSGSNQNLRSLALQQAQELKSHMMQQKQRRLSGSLTNLAVLHLAGSNENTTNSSSPFSFQIISSGFGSPYLTRRTSNSNNLNSSALPSKPIKW